MVDVGTGLAALGTAELSKDMIGKMLGPTAAYIGEGVRTWTEHRTRNVQRVFAKASARLGDEIDRPGTVPPRVLKAVLDEAQVADDGLMAEYLGGILASSRTETGRDDRAASAAQLVASLSTYAIRTHYIFYAAARRHFVGTDPAAWRTGNAGENRIFMSIGAYAQAMEFSLEERVAYQGIFADTLLGLDRTSLIGGAWASGSEKDLRGSVMNLAFPAAGIVYGLSQQGILLFGAAHGVREEAFAAFVSPEQSFDIEDAPSLPQTTLIRDLPAYEEPTAG